MKKYLELFLLFFLIIVFPKNVNASCSDEQIIRLNKLAKNIKLSYSYTEKNDAVKFNIVITNLNKDLVIIDRYTNKEYNLSGEVTINNINQNTENMFYIYPSDKQCNDDLLSTKTIEIPYYNKYYNDKICNNMEQYYFCQKFSNKSYEYEYIYEKITEINKKNNNTEKTKTTEKSIFSNIAYLYSKYYYLILPILITISCYGIYKKNKEDDLI